MKLVAILLFAAAAPENLILTAAAILAAVFLMLNQFGLLPRGKTAERLVIDRDEAERQLLKAQNELALLRSAPNLAEHAAILAGLSHSFTEHDKRMNDLYEKMLGRLDQLAETIARLNEPQ